MTTAGLQVIGDSDQIQIDQNYINYGLLAKGVISSTPLTTIWDTSGFQYSAYDIVVNASMPLLFVRATAGPVLFYAVKSDVANGQYTFTILTSDTSAIWYVFDVMSNLSSSDNFGLVVYTENGDVTFNSALKPLKIVTTSIMPDNSSNALPIQTGSVNGGYTGTFAACLNRTKIVEVDTTPYGNGHFRKQRYAEGVQISSSGASTQSMYYYDSGDSGSSSLFFTGQHLTGGTLMLIDVANV